jgi:Actin
MVAPPENLWYGPDIFLGSSQLRAGWATEPSPRFAIENLIARYKERRAPKTYCLIGNDVLADPAARLAAKGPYEGPIISNWDLMVHFKDSRDELMGIGNCAGLYFCKTWNTRGYIGTSPCNDRTSLQSEL